MLAFYRKAGDARVTLIFSFNEENVGAHTSLPDKMHLGLISFFEVSFVSWVWTFPWLGRAITFKYVRFEEGMFVNPA